MPYYESELDGEAAAFQKEQRDFQRYYNTPLEVDGVWFACVSDYEAYFRLKEMEEARCRKMSVELMSIIKQWVIEEKVEKMVDSLEQFPVLGKKTQ